MIASAVKGALDLLASWTATLDENCRNAGESLSARLLAAASRGGCCTKVVRDGHTCRFGTGFFREWRRHGHARLASPGADAARFLSRRERGSQGLTLGLCDSLHGKRRELCGTQTRGFGALSRVRSTFVDAGDLGRSG